MTGQELAMNLIHKSFLATATIDGNSERIPAQLSWAPTNPYAVRADFRNPNGWVEWTFALDMLAESVEKSDVTGQGDVMVSTFGPTVTIILRSSEGTAMVDIAKVTAESFLSAVSESEWSSPAKASLTMIAMIDNFLRDLGVESF